ncbi:hypothetical protein GALL_281080 [mine drainage metagenome]|uniref:Antitoxin SocA-like Panacea domain-containing protein n=1 Tax=mine drainage metagenome TaxID=410659 RepID=A0A1J5R3E2_9ZZZZ
MAIAAVESSFDVAYWFVDRALNDNEYIQPQKLHRLMYLSQAYFAVAYHGRRLMPALFVADEFGPIEPGVFRACAIQRPPIDPRPMPEAVSHFLDSIWRRFGSHTAEHLNQLVRGHQPYKDALARGERSEIPLKDMIAFYARKNSPVNEAVGAPPVTQVLRPKVMRSQSGKPVSVQKWMPPVKGGGER